MKKFILPFILLFSVQLSAQDSQNMTLLGNWDDNSLTNNNFFGFQYNDIWGYTSPQGVEYAILGNETWVIFIDITDSANPVEVTRVAPGGTSAWRDFKVWGDYAYGIIEGNEGLSIYDMTDIANGNVSVTTNSSQFTDAHNLYLDEFGRIFVCGVGPNLLVYDADANAADPTFLGTINLSPWGGYVHDLHVYNNKAYCSSGNAGMFIYDVTDIGNVSLLGSVTNYPEQGYNHNAWVSPDENTLVWTDETFDTGVKVADVSDLNDINITDIFRSTLEAPVNTESVAHNAYIKDNYAIVSYYGDGLQIFDISDLENVDQVAWYDTYPDNNGTYNYYGNWGVYPFFESGKIVASDTKYGLFIFEMNFNNVLVEAITVQGQGGVSEITTAGGSLQMEATVLPANASNNAVQWSVQNGTGSASIDHSGVLTAITDGTVTVKASATDGTGISGTTVITLSNQSVGVEDVNSLNANIYPNLIRVGQPLHVAFNSVPTSNVEVRITNLVGQQMFAKSIEPAEELFISIPDMASGIYLVELRADNKQVSRKLFVQ